MKHLRQTGPFPRLEDDLAITTYLREISRVPLLSAQEEGHLAQQIEAGRAEMQKPASSRNAHIVAAGALAHHTFVEANLRLVVNQARRYFTSSGTVLSFLDLCQEGTIGLLRALDHFEWRRGYKFSTYAIWWIRQALSRACETQGRQVRLPSHIYQKLFRVKRVQSQLFQQSGVLPTAEAIAAALEVSPATVRAMLSWDYHYKSLECLLEETPEWLPGELPEASNPPDVQDQMTEKPRADALLEALDHAGLTPREYQVITWRYGFRDHQEHSSAETGQLLTPAISRERVRQLETSALKKLRCFFHATPDSEASVSTALRTGGPS